MSNLLRGCFSPIILIGSVLVALVLVGVTLGVVWFNRPEPTSIAVSTAVINVIRAPTSTPIPPTPTRTPEPTPTVQESEVPPSPPPGSITVDAFVQITGTEGDGLRLRSEPSLSATVRILGGEAEVFQVSDGPVDADGYTWWYLVGPYDQTRTGWAVSNYLAVVQNP